MTEMDTNKKLLAPHEFIKRLRENFNRFLALQGVQKKTLITKIQFNHCAQVSK